MGDTAIYFGPPPQMPEQNDKDYHYIKQHFDRVHVVKSSNLRLMGDESRFTDRDLLNSTKSFRAERKLRKLGVLSSVEAAHGGKFKYYIDLRPPNEDDEAVILITDLTCTRGVLTWHLAMKKYDLSPLAVLGHDEFGVQPHVDMLVNPAISSQNTEDAAASPSKTAKPRSKSGSSNEKPAPLASAPQISPEYSPLRHWSALERVLQAIQGNDPKLDSAPKLWTFFAVARYFGCAIHERISGWIMTWLHAGNNSNFIQNNPEVAYRIAMGIKSVELIRDSFSILVGERALVEACGEFNPEILTLRRQSVHGRKLELLDDDERNRIDHAASSFVKRIREAICSMCQDMDFLHESAVYAILDNAVGQTRRAVEALKSTKTTVKEYVRSRIYYVLCQDQGCLRNLEPEPKSTLPFRSASIEDYGTVYRSLNQKMRHFTKTFWLALQHTRFDEGTHSTSHEGTIGWETTTPYHEALHGLYRNDPLNGISRVPRATLERKINIINQMFHRGEVIHGKRSPKRRKTCDSDDCSHRFGNTDNPISSSSVLMPITPSWRPAPPEPAPTIPAPRPEPPAFALRPKPTSEESHSQQTNNNGAWSFHGKQNEIPMRPKRAAPDNARMNGTPEPRCEPDTLVETHIPEESMAPLQSNLTPAIPPPPAAAAAEDVSASSASHKFFNPYTGKYEGQDIQEQMWDNQAAPYSPRSGKRVKQYFSNSNTDTEVTMPLPPSYRFPINPAALLNDVTAAIEKICSSNLYPPHLFHQTSLLPTDLYDNLLCLTANEFRYLPLWVPDGNDDETGGVFEEVHVPNLDPIRTSIESFGPGRIKRGFDQADTDVGSDIDEITSSQAISTVGKASKLATDGTRTVKSVSSASTVNVTRETESADLEDPVVVDHGVVHMGQVPPGMDDEGDTDMLNIDELDDDNVGCGDDDDGDDDDVGGAFEDGDSDISDGFNHWDDNRAEESPTTQINMGDECRSNDTNPDFEAMPTAADTDDDDGYTSKDSGKGKGKAKAQNFSHGFDLPDLPDLPVRDPTAAAAGTEGVLHLHSHHQDHQRPHPHPHPHSHGTRSGPGPHRDHASSSSSVVLIDMGDDDHHNHNHDEEGDDGFELV
ncbi:hypothetical protein CLAIMM_09153 [Cladophialophora immunda]|nr:hypothetical protein CLAIMM_09153 [Cladophialophora immunda]